MAGGGGWTTVDSAAIFNVARAMGASAPRPCHLFASRKLYTASPSALESDACARLQRENWFEISVTFGAKRASSGESQNKHVLNSALSSNFLEQNYSIKGLLL